MTLLLAGSSTPAASEITPGLIGFLATFAVVLATVLLMLDLVRRLRRLKYRAELAERAEQAEQAERAQQAGLQGRGETDAAPQAHTGTRADEPGPPAGRPAEPEVPR